MFEKEIEQKILAERKAQLKREKQRRRKTPRYKGYSFRNWLVYPLGVISVELDLARARKYQALEWSEEKALEIIEKYFVKICDYEEETKELSFSTDWSRPWEHDMVNVHLVLYLYKVTGLYLHSQYVHI